MKLVIAIASIYLALLSQAGIRDAATYCSWETSSSSKKYSFNLLTSSGHPYGARSEDGFYMVSEKSKDGKETTYWFQLCEHMQFNFNSPKCDNCESCGGPLHCGETCSALQSSSDGDSEKPELGVAVKMVASGLQETCSFSVSIYCSTKKEVWPKTVTREDEYRCDYTTSFYHSAGCPVVTNLSRGGMGWFATIVIMLLCLFVVYLAVGIGYRVTVLGVSGLEAIPNLDFWKTLPYTIQLYVEAAISFIMGCYRRFTEPTYTRVNG